MDQVVFLAHEAWLSLRDRAAASSAFVRGVSRDTWIKLFKSALAYSLAMALILIYPVNRAIGITNYFTPVAVIQFPPMSVVGDAVEKLLGLGMAVGCTYVYLMGVEGVLVLLNQQYAVPGYENGWWQLLGLGVGVFVLSLMKTTYPRLAIPFTDGLFMVVVALTVAPTDSAVSFSRLAQMVWPLLLGMGVTSFVCVTIFPQSAHSQMKKTYGDASRDIARQLGALVEGFLDTSADQPLTATPAAVADGTTIVAALSRLSTLRLSSRYELFYSRFSRFGIRASTHGLRDLVQHLNGIRSVADAKQGQVESRALYGVPGSSNQPPDQRRRSHHEHHHHAPKTMADAAVVHPPTTPPSAETVTNDSAPGVRTVRLPQPDAAGSSDTHVINLENVAAMDGPLDARSSSLQRPRGASATGPQLRRRPPISAAAAHSESASSSCEEDEADEMDSDIFAVPPGHGRRAQRSDAVTNASMARIGNIELALEAVKRTSAPVGGLAHAEAFYSDPNLASRNVDQPGAASLAGRPAQVPPGGRPLPSIHVHSPSLGSLGALASGSPDVSRNGPALLPVLEQLELSRRDPSAAAETTAAAASSAAAPGALLNRHASMLLLKRCVHETVHENEGGGSRRRPPAIPRALTVVTPTVTPEIAEDHGSGAMVVPSPSSPPLLPHNPPAAAVAESLRRDSADSSVGSSAGDGLDGILGDSVYTETLSVVRGGRVLPSGHTVRGALTLSSSMQHPGRAASDHGVHVGRNMAASMSAATFGAEAQNQMTVSSVMTMPAKSTRADIKHAIRRPRPLDYSDDLDKLFPIINTFSQPVRRLVSECQLALEIMGCMVGGVPLPAAAYEGVPATPADNVTSSTNDAGILSESEQSDSDLDDSARKRPTRSGTLGHYLRQTGGPVDLSSARDAKSRRPKRSTQIPMESLGPDGHAARPTMTASGPGSPTTTTHLLPPECAAFKHMPVRLGAAIESFHEMHWKQVKAFYTQRSAGARTAALEDDDQPLTDELVMVYFLAFSLREFAAALRGTAQRLADDMDPQGRSRFCWPHLSDWETVFDPTRVWLGLRRGRFTNRFMYAQGDSFMTRMRYWSHLWLLRLSNIVRSYEFKFALKCAISCVVFAVPANANADSNRYYTQNRLSWILVTIVLVMQPTAGGSVYVSLYRIIGTLAGSVFAYVLAVALPLNPYWYVAMSAVYCVPWFYLMLRTSHVKLGMTALLTVPVILLTDYNQYTMGPRAYYDSALRVTLQRMVATMIGITIAMALSMFVWPLIVHVKLRASLASTIFSLNYVYSRIISLRMTMNPANKDEHEKQLAKEVDKIQRTISMHDDLVLLADHEFALKQPFDSAIFVGLNLVCQDILAQLQCFRAVLSADFGPAFFREIIWPVNTYRRDVYAAITVSFHVISNALATKSPLPPYLPNIRGARHRLMTKLRALPAMRASRQVASLEDHSRYLYFYAYALAMREISRDVQLLAAFAKELVGEDDYMKTIFEPE